MKLDEIKDEDLAWLGLEADMTLAEIPKWLERFANSGYCGHHYPGDAFCSSSNATATWVSSLADFIKAAYKREIDTVRPFVRDAEAAYSEAILVSVNEDVEKDVICRQGAAQEWLNNHPEDTDNGQD